MKVINQIMKYWDPYNEIEGHINSSHLIFSQNFTLKYFEIYTPQVCALLLCEKEAIHFVKTLTLIRILNFIICTRKKKKRSFIIEISYP